VSNIVQDASSHIGLTARFSSEVPPNASAYQKVCLRPLPTNTFLDARVQVDDSTIDFYYHQEKLPGAQSGDMKWVCRQTVVDVVAPEQQEGDPGNNIYQTQYIDNANYDSKASGICEDPTAGFFSQLACGTASFSDLPQAAKWVIYGIAGLIVLLLLVWLVSVTRALGG
jgi:hypothetical protein